MNLAPVRTVAPSVPLVTTVELKAQCRIDSSDDDTLLDGLIAAATAHLDGYSGILGRALLEQTWQRDFADFSDCMRMPVGDLMSAPVVTYYDIDNVQQVLSSDAYSALSDEIGPFITLNDGYSWPSVATRLDAVRLTWVAGYGATAADVPAAIKHAVMLLAADWYEHRENSALGAGNTAIELPFGVNALVGPFCRNKI